MKAANAAIAQLILGAIEQPRPPQKLQLVQAYTVKYLDKFRDELQAQWNVHQAAKGITKTITKPSLSFRNARMQARLDQESADVRLECELFRNTKHAEDMRAYEKKMLEDGLLVPDEFELDPDEQERLCVARSRMR